MEEGAGTRPESGSSSSSYGFVLSSCGEDTVLLRKCLLSGFFDHAAQLTNRGNYCTIRGKVSVSIHSSSVLARFGAPPDWIVFTEVVHSGSEEDSGPSLRDVSRIDPRWLLDVAPHYYALNSKKR